MEEGTFEPLNGLMGSSTKKVKRNELLSKKCSTAGTSKEEG